MIERRARRLARWAFAAIFMTHAGLHWLLPAPFMAITPEGVGDRRLVVQVTGIAALAGGVGLLFPQTRRWAGFGLSLYYVCVYPANIRHAFESIAMNDVTLSWLSHGPRLLLLPVFAWRRLWAWGVVDWPFRARA